MTSTAQQHLDKFRDFIELKELDDDDVKMRLLELIFSREMEKWFKQLSAGIIHNFEEFETTFLKKWEDNKNHLQILTNYRNIKKNNGESVQEFSTRFMKLYISIPIDIKHLVAAGKHHFADYFDSDFALLLRERKLENIESMNKDAIEV